MPKIGAYLTKMLQFPFSHLFYVSKAHFNGRLRQFSFQSILHRELHFYIQARTAPRLSAEHDPCAEYTVLIGKRACPAGAFRDVADGSKAHAVPRPRGGARDAVFFLHRTVEWVFDLDEQQTRGVKISISSFFCVAAAEAAFIRSCSTPGLAWEALADYCLEHSDELDELAHTGTAWAGYPSDWAAASDELMDELLGVLL